MSKFIVLIFVSPHLAALISVIQEPLSNDKAVIALNQTLIDLSSRGFSTLNIFLQSGFSQNDSLNEILISSNLMPIQLMRLGVSSQTKSFKSSVILFWLHSDKEMRQIFRQQSLSNLRSGEVFLLFINSDVKMFNLADVFEMFAALFIYNMNVLTLNKNKVVMVSFWPFQDEKCRNVNPAIINVFNETSCKWSGDEIFPNKLRNFHKCPLRVSTLEYPPAVMKKLDKGEVKYYGSDIEVIEGLASAMNFTVNLAFIAEPYNFGEIFENHSTGAISPVVSGDADIAMGFYFLIHDKLKFLSHSCP